MRCGRFENLVFFQVKRLAKVNQHSIFAREIIQNKIKKKSGSKMLHMSKMNKENYYELASKFNKLKIEVA